MVSADCHANEPHDLWADPHRREVPRARAAVITDENGVKWRVSEGHRPDRLRTDDLEGEDGLRQRVGADPVERLRDMARDGIDVEVIFPNKGLRCGPRPIRCSRWPSAASTTTGRTGPSAPTATAWRPRPPSPPATWRARSRRWSAWPSSASALLTLPCKPIWGGARRGPPELQPADVRPALGGDPGREPAGDLPRLDRARPAGRARQRRRGDQLRLALALAHHRAGGQPLRLRRLRALPAPARGHDRGGHRLGAVVAGRDGRGVRASTTSGCGPKLKRLPSEYYREHCWASFQEDPAGLALAEPMDLADSFMWANDYPAPRGHVAAFGRGHRAHDGPPHRARGRTCSASTRRASSASRCRRAGSREPGNDPRSSDARRPGPIARRARDGHPGAGSRARGGLALRELSAQLERPRAACSRCCAP